MIALECAAPLLRPGISERAMLSCPPRYADPLCESWRSVALSCAVDMCPITLPPWSPCWKTGPATEQKGGGGEGTVRAMSHTCSNQNWTKLSTPLYSMTPIQHVSQRQSAPREQHPFAQDPTTPSPHKQACPAHWCGRRPNPSCRPASRQLPFMHPPSPARNRLQARAAPALMHCTQ